MGFRCVEASNGTEALEQFDVERPDLVFMDIKMPVMDGIEATERIRERDVGCDTPVVALTANVFEEDRIKASESGIDAFIMKPFQEERIWKVLEWVLEVEFTREEAADEEQVKLPTLSREDFLALGTEMVEALREAVESADLDRASELLDQSAGDHPETVSRLKTMVDAFDFDSLEGLLQS